MGHRSFRSFTTESLHQVWCDYKLAPKTDEFCEGYKIVTSRSTARQHIGTPVPKIPFKYMYGDIIHSPTKQGLTTSSTFPCSLLLVCAYTKYSWLHGMKGFSFDSVIECFKIFLVLTGSRAYDLQCFITDDGTAFASAEFKDFSQKEIFSVTFAAPHRQEKNSMSERYRQSIDNMAQSMRVHACIPMQLFYHSTKYACEISNALPGENLKNDQGEPTTPFFLALKIEPCL
eukprot:3624939-Ditylum_brightwellii.AAC.1